MILLVVMLFENNYLVVLVLPFQIAFHLHHHVLELNLKRILNFKFNSLTKTLSLKLKLML